MFFHVVIQEIIGDVYFESAFWAIYVAEYPIYDFFLHLWIHLHVDTVPYGDVYHMTTLWAFDLLMSLYRHALTSNYCLAMGQITNGG